MIVNIKDDFDIKRIAESGQCFRVNPDKYGSFCFLAGDKKCLVRQGRTGSCEYEVSADESEWNGFWKHYFDLERKYSDIRKTAGEMRDEFMAQACEAGQGIRILNQDPWEMLISFIISQRKSIPAIKSCIEKISRAFGKDMGGYFAFPTPEALDGADSDILAACGLGYRLEYIKDAAHRVRYGELDLEAIKGLSDEALRNTLKEVKGVGDKVANCIMLFAYHRTGSVPIDTWVKKIMEEDYGGNNPFLKYGENAGIMQQYAFFYKRLK